MEHIVQFGVVIDDDAIQKEVTRQAANALQDRVEKMDRSNYREDTELQRMAQKVISEYVARHEDEIIGRAVESLTERMMKTKKVREAIGKVTEEV